MPAFTPNLNLYKPGGGSTGLITPDEVVDVDRFNQNFDLLDAFAGSTSASLSDLTKRGRTAKLVKTNGFQSLSSTGAVVTGLSPLIIHSGYSWDSAGNVLTITESGTYLINVLVYGSGSDLNQITMGFNDAALTPVEGDGPMARLLRTSAAADGIAFSSVPFVLDADAKLRLVARSTAGTPSIFGGASNTGDATHFSVVRLGPSSM